MIFNTKFLRGEVIRKCLDCGVEIVALAHHHVRCKDCAKKKHRIAVNERNIKLRMKKEMESKKKSVNKVSYDDEYIHRMMMVLIIDSYNNCRKYLKNKEKIDFDSENHIIGNKLSIKNKNTADIKRILFEESWNFMFGGYNGWVDIIADFLKCKRAVRIYRELLLKAKEGENVPKAEIQLGLFDAGEKEDTE